MDTTIKQASTEVVLACDDLDDALAYLTKQLGFRLERIFPADSPRVAVVSNGSNRIRLEARADRRKSGLLVLGEAPPPPAGLDVTVVEDADALVVPPLEPALVLRRAQDGDWETGRAGMQYRDLLPGRLGGRFIASHIRIPTGGPVPDYVHHHHVRFQMIFCYRGWVRVVYEDQGEPFVMRAGDCVLQPPHIRHRVLECSDGFEVVEIGCPAEHETLVDHEMALPTPELRPDRDFGGQRFVFHCASGAEWTARDDGFAVRDTGIAEATRALAGVVVARAGGPLPTQKVTHDAELVFRFVLRGQVDVQVGDRAPQRLGASDAIAIPAGTAYAFAGAADDFEMLEVALSAEYETETA